MTHQSCKVDFTLTIDEIHEDFWEARITDSTGDFFSYGTTEELAVRNVLEFFSRKGYDRIKREQEANDTQGVQN